MDSVMKAGQKKGFHVYTHAYLCMDSMYMPCLYECMYVCMNVYTYSKHPHLIVIHSLRILYLPRRLLINFCGKSSIIPYTCKRILLWHDHNSNASKLSHRAISVPTAYAKRQHSQKAIGVSPNGSCNNYIFRGISMSLTCLHTHSSYIHVIHTDTLHPNAASLVDAHMSHKGNWGVPQWVISVGPKWVIAAVPQWMNARSQPMGNPHCPRMGASRCHPLGNPWCHPLVIAYVTHLSIQLSLNRQFAVVTQWMNVTSQPMGNPHCPRMGASRCYPLVNP